MKKIVWFTFIIYVYYIILYYIIFNFLKGGQLHFHAPIKANAYFVSETRMEIRKR